MKKYIAIILVATVSHFAVADEYDYILDLLDSHVAAKAAKSALDNHSAIEIVKITNDTVERVTLVRSAINFAKLRLWFLQQSRPKIFINIEMAENATDLGYFRLDYDNASEFGKLQLLDEYNYLF